MSLNIKQDTFEVVGRTRPYLELPTSMIFTIKKNLNRLLEEDLQGDPMMIEAIREAWRAEIRDADAELIKRN